MHGKKSMWAHIISIIQKSVDYYDNLYFMMQSVSGLAFPVCKEKKKCPLLLHHMSIVTQNFFFVIGRCVSLGSVSHACHTTSADNGWTHAHTPQRPKYIWARTRQSLSLPFFFLFVFADTEDYWEEISFSARQKGEFFQPFSVCWINAALRWVIICVLFLVLYGSHWRLKVKQVKD